MNDNEVRPASADASPAQEAPTPTEQRQKDRQQNIEKAKKDVLALLDTLGESVSQASRDTITGLLDQGLRGHFKIGNIDPETGSVEISRTQLAQVGDVVLVRDLNREHPAIVTKVYHDALRPYETLVDANLFFHGIDDAEDLQEARARREGNTWIGLKVLLRDGDHPDLEDPNGMIAFAKKDDTAATNDELLISFMATMLQDQAKNTDRKVMAVAHGLLELLNEIGKHFNSPTMTMDNVRAASLRSIQRERAEKQAAKEQPAEPVAPADPQTPATPHIDITRP